MPKFVNLFAFLQKLISKEHVVVIIEFPDWFKLKWKYYTRKQNVTLYLRIECKKLYRVRQVKIFFKSANCTFGEQLQNTNTPLII